jgi:hypothetical protein
VRAAAHALVTFGVVDVTREQVELHRFGSYALHTMDPDSDGDGAFKLLYNTTPNRWC